MKCAGAAMLKEEGFLLMGAAFEVYNQLGYGMSEEIYQQCLELELQERKIPFRSKPELRMSYKSHELHAKYRPDLVVFESIVVELKSVSGLISEHEAQLFNYMRITRYPIGYLLNFGQKSQLEWKRFIISDFHSRDRKTWATEIR